MTTPAKIRFYGVDGSEQATIHVSMDGGPHNPFGVGQRMFNFLNGMDVALGHTFSNLETGFGLYALGAGDAAAQLVAHLSDKVTAANVFIDHTGSEFEVVSGWVYHIRTGREGEPHIDIEQVSSEEVRPYKSGDANFLLTLASDEDGPVEQEPQPELVTKIRETIWFLNGYLGSTGVRAFTGDCEFIVELHGNLGVPLAAIEQRDDEDFRIYEIVPIFGDRDEPESIYYKERSTAKNIRSATGKTVAMMVGIAIGALQESNADQFSLAENEAVLA